jgi:hypothetical protein
MDRVKTVKEEASHCPILDGDGQNGKRGSFSLTEIGWGESER